MRNAEVIRQWKILRRIEAGRLTTVRDLAEEHQVTDRTVRRDLEALQEAGFPLYDERCEGRRVWRLVEGHHQRLSQSFTLAEMAALYFGKNLMSILAGAPFARDIDSAFEKIRGALPARSLPFLSRIQSLFVARPEPRKDYSRKRELIAQLIDATLHQRKIVLDYFSFRSRRRKQYAADPYRVVYYHGGLYLYARVQEYEEVRTFAVERIHRIEVLEEEFETPGDFDLTEYSRGAFGIAAGRPESVSLCFSAEIAGYVRERIWHESQTIDEQEDGSVILRMRVAVNRELRAWVKGYLPNVEVLAPESLRNKIALEIDRARELFCRPASSQK
ncbi:MAG: WYL domain-containing protein [Vicinamibacteria bacterium]|nr:WYL domain-containing protein [Vicinamibacteria bacterium]